MWEKFQAWLNSLGTFALGKVLPAVILLAVGLVCIRLILRVLKAALKKSKLEKTAHNLIRSVAKVVMTALLCLIVASFLGIDVTGIVALASVLTLAISLALQDALANLIGGFTLLNTKPFVAGDYVEVAGQGGTVQEVGLAYTKLTTGDNKMISIPNSAVVASEIVNYTTTGTRRVDISIQVSYNSDPDLVLEALKKAAQVPTALDTPVPYAAVSAYNDSTVGYVLQVWSSASDYWTTLHTVNRNIKTVFEEMGVILTYPHLNVHIDK